MLLDCRYMLSEPDETPSSNKKRSLSDCPAAMVFPFCTKSALLVMVKLVTFCVAVGGKGEHAYNPRWTGSIRAIRSYSGSNTNANELDATDWLVTLMTVEPVNAFRV